MQNLYLWGKNSRVRGIIKKKNLSWGEKKNPLIHCMTLLGRGVYIYSIFKFYESNENLIVEMEWGQYWPETRVISSFIGGV